MDTKTQELDVRNILQGLEELATFISYQSNYEGLRILSVTSQQEERATAQAATSAQILRFGSKTTLESDSWQRRTG